MVVHSPSYSLVLGLSAIYFLTVSPSPLTAAAQPLLPEASQPYGSRELGGTDRYINKRI